jgi:hypothetical protein
MIDKFKPGQKIRCTIVKLPRARASRKTVERLMWRDAAVSKGLRKSQKMRRRNTVVYNRGNRDWVQRLKCPRIIEVRVGEGWTLAYDPCLAADLSSVSSYLKIEA